MRAGHVKLPAQDGRSLLADQEEISTHTPPAACGHTGLDPSQALLVLPCVLTQADVKGSTRGGSTAGAALQEHGELQAAVEVSCMAAGLQPVAPLVHKCLQLHETFSVRFGGMLIGPTGKDGCCPVLMSGCTLHCCLHQTVLEVAGQDCAQLQAQKCQAAGADLLAVAARQQASLQALSL